MTSEAYRLESAADLVPSPVLPALVWAEGIAPPRPTDAAPPFLAEALAETQTTGEAFVPIELRQRVRRMLRHGKYKPSGRGKPASEFLLRAALTESFPLVNGPVDVNNVISLQSGLPASIFDADAAGSQLLLRRGLPGETYVFNPSGQTIDLQDLLLVCRRSDAGWQPCGNPVKDSMSTKTGPDTRNLVAVIYAPIDEPLASVERWAARFAELLEEHCGAERSGYHIGADGP